MKRRAPPQAGFTLLEVLATLVILAIGLLGLARLQIAAMQYTHSALLRSQALLLAHDIMERMRANRTLAAAGAYSTEYETQIQTPPDCLTLTCSATQMVSYDVAQWQADLASLLPEGSGAITMLPSGGMERLLGISIRWNDQRKTNVSDFTTFSWSAEL
ncbi:MAG: type IV pilus modification protein PilV [Magnetococcales bacterium]|nr:type IV pilus modification protein PilV [Magnetococcales bacterium]MBF0114022.1 type IV pilus modification protein PilV [Magnetococcales bacterium]